MTVRFRCVRGEHVYRQGERAGRLYRAETGMVRLARMTGRGRTVTVRHILPGDFFGEETLNEVSYGHGAEALTNATITSFDLGELNDALLLEVARSLGDQMRRTMTHEVHVQSGDLRQRIVRYLLELADTPLGAEDAENHLYVRATHELLAEGSGSTRESVSKIITDLRTEALIESGYRHVTLLDLERLREIAAQATAPGEEVRA